MPKRPKVHLFDHSPHLRGEWDYEKNVGLDPESILPFSNKKVWWRCSEGHSWSVAPSQRSHGYGCSFCSGRYVIEGETDLRTTHPDLARELVDPDLGGIIPKGTAKRVLWRCTSGHEYTAPVNSRTNMGSGCPYCTNQRVLAGYNDLLTLNPEVCKYLVDPSLATTLTVSSGKKVEWVCDLGHKWLTSVASVSRNGTRCAVCSNKRVLVGFNDLRTTNPELSAELEDPEMYKVLTFASNKRVWWVCAKNHRWCTTVNNRTNGKGCPSCSLQQTSRIESSLRELFSRDFNLISVDHTYKLPVPYRNNRYMSVDIYFEIDNKKVVVEYDGSYFHSKKECEDRDLEKTMALLSKGYFVIRFRETSKGYKLSHLPIDHEKLYQLTSPYSEKHTHLEGLFEMTKEWLETRDG